MVTLTTEQSKLLSGMLQSADIASNFMNIISSTDDMNHAENELTTVKNLYASIPTYQQILLNKFSMTGAGKLQDAQNQVLNTLPNIATMQREALYWGKMGWNSASSMRAMKIKMQAQLSFLDTSLSMLFDIPEGILKEKAKDYWLSVIRPAEPSESLVVQQYMRGNLTATQAAEYLADKGVPDSLISMLYDAQENYPSIREMVVASQVTAITDTQLRANMKYSNITKQANIDFYMNYAHALQLRTELNQYLQQLRADYVAGFLTHDELAAEIAAHKPNANEQAQILENCDKQRTRTLLNMEVQSRTWLYRKGVYGETASDDEAENLFYDNLIEINLDPLMSNALVRFEAAKLGYNWEHE
jgi:hypothetical protein